MRDPAAEGSRFASGAGCKRIEAGSLLPIEVRRRKDRSLLRFEAANGSRRGVRFSSKAWRAEGSGFASISRLAKRVRQDREVRLSIAACPCGKAIGLSRIGGLRRHSFPGSSVFPSGRQAARSGRSRPLRTDRGGQGKAPAFRRTLGTARWVLRRSSSQPLRSGARRKLLRRFGNGERASRPRPCPDSQGTAQASRPGRDPRGSHGGFGHRAVSAHPAGDRVAEAGHRETGTLGAGGNASPHFGFWG